VLQAIPNAIGALCLNQTGQDQLAARPSIIPGLFSIFTSERHQRVLQDKENAALIGTAIDELIRHHPFLKSSVFEAVRSTLGRIEDLGNAYVVPAHIRSWYQLVPESDTQENIGDVAMDVDVEVSTIGTAEIVGVVDDAASESAEEKEDSAKSHDNHIVSFIDVTCRVNSFYTSWIPILITLPVYGRSLPASSSLQGFCHQYWWPGTYRSSDSFALFTVRLCDQRCLGFDGASHQDDEWSGDRRNFGVPLQAREVISRWNRGVLEGGKSGVQMVAYSGFYSWVSFCPMLLPVVDLNILSGKSRHRQSEVA
jgi:hypothetical protein